MEEGEKYNDEDLGKDKLKSAEDDMITEMADQFFRAERDIAEVKSDPMYEETRKSVDFMMTGYSRDKLNPETEEFITGNMTMLKEDYNMARKEAGNNRIDEITAEWVEEWHKNKQKNGSHAQEIREFVKESFRKADKKAAARPEEIASRPHKSLIMKYSLAAAAVLAGAVIIITSLLSSGNPDRLFDRYYKPVHALSQVTRNTDAAVSAAWEDAVNSYNIGDYNKASTGFAELSDADPLLIPPRFYLGLSYLAEGKYTEASELLEGVADTRLEYSQEALWYLGLIRLKTGDKDGAALCFEMLSSRPGYYSEASAKILRRLK